MSALLTVVIPTYNRAAYLRVAIQSVLDQTYQDFEILVSDNASSDNTADVVASFGDARIRYHRHARNIGPTPNWRFVMTQPQTEYIAPLADDDYYLPAHLETGLQAIKQYPQAAYYTCAAEYFGDTKTLGLYRPVALSAAQTPLLYVAPPSAVKFLGTDNPGPLNCMVCCRTALHADLFWGRDDYLPQDLLIMTQLMVQGGFVFGSRPLCRFRVHANNTSLSTERRKIWRFNMMAWFGIRWLAQFLLDERVCSLDDIEQHGRESAEWERHVVPLVLALSSYDSSPELQAVAKHIFAARRDVDAHSARFRLARRLGFWTLPFAEKLTQQYVGWKP